MAILSVVEQSAQLMDPENKIPWDDLKKWGLTPDFIMQEDMRQNARGAVVSKFVNHGFSPIFKVRPDYKSNDVSITGQLSGAVRFYNMKDGTCKIEFQLARPQYKLEDDIYINDYTVLRADATDAKEKLAHDNLVKTGFANIPVTVRDPKWKNDNGGEYQECIVALDLSDDKRQGTNQAQYHRVSWIEAILDKHHGEVCGAALTLAERKAYLSGENVFLKGMKFGKNGKTFDSYVRYNPISGQATFSKGLAEKQAETESREVKVEEEVKQTETKSKGVRMK